MRRILSIILCAVLLCGSACADTLRVSGSATVAAQCDSAVIYLGAEFLESDVSAAQGALNQAVADILAALEGDEPLALDEQDIRTESYYLNQEYSYNYETDESVPAGYRAGCMLSIQVRDVSLAARVIDVAFGAGANRMNGIEFCLADDTAVKDQVLALAIEDGMRKAKLAAQAAGISLEGMTLSLDCTGGSYGVDNGMRTYATAESAGDAAKGASVRGGTSTYSATVTLTYSTPE